LRESELSGALLPWYDRHARALPWRVGPQARAQGVRPDPYAVWLSEIMLQQTTVAAVRDYFRRFVTLWPDVGALAAAEDADVMGEWAGLGYYARARNLLRCARVVAGELGGEFPDTAPALQALPGIGPYTSAAIAAIAFDRPETVVDGNVERVMARLHAVEQPLPACKPHLRELAARHTPLERPGDYAQAVMDLGATICTPRSPACGICPASHLCAARAADIAGELPRRSPKAAKPVRHGAVFLARRGEEWLLERRPERGLLGGMLGWPGGDWAETAPPPQPPLPLDWREIGQVRHTFTHFHLILTVYHGEVPEGAATAPASGSFMRLRPADLPTLMRKAYDLARDATKEGVSRAQPKQ